MVFEFEKGTDIGLYKKYRFFYVTEVFTTPQLPTTGSGFNGVKMAFPARRIDADCQVMQTNGGWASRYTFPAIITYNVGNTELITSIHKDNEDKHISPDFKELVENTSNSFSSHVDDDSHLTDEQKSKISTIDSLKEKIDDIYAVLNIKKENFTTLKEGFSSPDNQRMSAGMVVLSKAHFTSGLIKSISFPYYGGLNATVYLAVQIIKEDENVNVTKTFEQTVYSKDPVNQPSGNGITTFEFDNLFIPEKYKAVRLGFVLNNTDVPQHNAENCLSGRDSNAFRIKILQDESNGNTWDSDECEIYTAPSYGYSNHVVHLNAVVYNSSLNPLYTHILEIDS